MGKMMDSFMSMFEDEEMPEKETTDLVPTIQERPATKPEPDGALLMCTSSLLKRATDNYASRIYNEIRDDVISDVKECSTYLNSGGFGQRDVQLAIGRALCKRLGIEV